MNTLFLLLLSASLCASSVHAQEEEPAVSTETAAAPQPRLPPALTEALARGHDLYFSGDLEGSVAQYRRAVKVSSVSVEGWLNGAAALEELGRPKEAVGWYQKAAALRKDPAIMTALGMARFRVRDYKGAQATLRAVLKTHPDEPYALLGLARARLAGKDPTEALALLKRTAEVSPLLNLTYFFMGKTYEALGDPARTVESYRQAVTSDSYFHEGRDALGREYLRQRSAQEAWRQFSRILAADPNNKRVRELVRKVEPLLTGRTGAPAAQADPYLAPDARPDPTAPTLRAAIWTDGMGKPRARERLAFSGTVDFDVVDAATGDKLASGKAGDFWTVEVQKRGKKRLLQLSDPEGRWRLTRPGPVSVVPVDRQKGLLALTEGSPRPTPLGAPRLLRGELEFALHKRGLRIVNTLDLESYTHGVVSSEMPIRSPLEALKAQAVVARSHALFIKRVTRRHRKDGYDVCDEQHCQVYSGVRAESQRSRAVVEGTRGKIATYQGKVAHVIYSSNCGGHTQSGKDVTGWGDVPYWRGVPDGPALAGPPRSPWELRVWLTSSPQAYCRPSGYVHPSHFRWTRVITLKELDERVQRRYKIGRLVGLRPLRRSPSGNVNSLLLIGAKKKQKVDSEMAIRGILGVGSVRSTLFVFLPEYGADMKPELVVFHGGGWGHAVGLCQSGAMGRAEAGQSYEQIVRAYFPGTELGRADY